MVSKRSEHCLAKRKTNILDFTRQEFSSIPVICSALLAQQACLEAEQGKYSCQGKYRAAVVVSGSKNVFSCARDAKSRPKFISAYQASFDWPNCARRLVQTLNMQ